jgi:TrmH family RNA methyltransferase
MATHADSDASRLSAILKRAQTDERLVVLEGFHPLKHALRFGAAVEEVFASDPLRVVALAHELAPDLAAELEQRITGVEPDVMKLITPNVPYTGVIAIARKPEASPEEILGATRKAPIILLENPRHFGNMGAVVRVAAAADVAGVLTTGVHDPWDPAAIRGAAGLHFAVPVARLAASLPDTPRQLVALTPGGGPIQPSLIDDRAVLAFGTERDGLSATVLRRADLCVRLPMREGVSSLNLATSVAATLYSLTIARGAT